MLPLMLAEHLPVFALPDDSIVEIQGEPEGLQKAVELIATHLRKFLVDRSVIGIFETQMQMPNARGNQNSLPDQSWGPPPPAFPMNPGGHGYGPNPMHMPRPHQYDNYYPPVDMPTLDKQPRMGPPTYGRDVSMGAHITNVQPQQAVVAKVTQNMQIPLSYADAVIGVNGANISYIRRASGATIAIQETRGIPGEMTVEINGSASQVQAAQQLIQNSLADAASGGAQNAGGGLPVQGYNPYPSHGPYSDDSTFGKHKFIVFPVSKSNIFLVIPVFSAPMPIILFVNSILLSRLSIFTPSFSPRVFILSNTSVLPVPYFILPLIVSAHFESPKSDIERESYDQNTESCAETKSCAHKDMGSNESSISLASSYTIVSSNSSSTRDQLLYFERGDQYIGKD
ncbi:flowering locus K homology domain-like [Olea europaea var. sylvestris]|uniref:flowering locus K homology domain-like n=1 Tax=Olea europaea var. sylvestris TaxID=158386 RepID=UPI000C1CEB1C|nr:flowering locus K homology domain-like [Olea europaea var. sylvestris]